MKTPDCPDCGEPMVKRENNYDCSIFWGCSGYPDCKACEPFEGEEDNEGWDQN